MNTNIWVITLGDSIAIATSLVLVALGVLLNERAGVLNLGVEGSMLVGAVTGALVTDGTGSIWLGLVLGALAGAAMGGVHGVLCVSLRSNQIVTGLAMVIFGTGLANFIGKPVEGTTLKTRFLPMDLGPLEDIPLLGRILFTQDPITYLSIAFAAVLSWYVFRTRPGLTLRALGDDPATVDAQGLSVSRLRILYTVASGSMIGLGGAWLLLARSSTWQQAATTGGKGWIALALVVFAGWRPIRVVLGAVLFGFALQVPFTLQAEQITFVPIAFLDMFPYLVTLVTLVAMSTPKARQTLGAPRALGLPFVRDER